MHTKSASWTTISPYRDTDKVFEAVLEARKGTEEGDERALQPLKESQADIKDLVRVLPSTSEHYG